MADLLVLTGPPGAGKSTVAQLLVKAFDPACLVPGDAFFGFWTQGAVAPWLPEADHQNGVVLRAAAAAAGTFVAGGCTVVYDGVLGPWFLDLFTAATGLPRLHYAILLPTLEQCLERVATRSAHAFDDAAATRAMYQEFAAADIEERHVLSDLPERPGQVVDEVLARLGDGTLLHRP